MEKLKRVEVIWCDALNEGGGRKTLKMVTEWAETVDPNVHEVGYIVKDTPEYLLLVKSYMEEDGDYKDT